MNRKEYLIPDDDEYEVSSPFDGAFEKGKVFSVAQLNEFVKGCFDANPFFSSVRVRGEISNLSCSGGHAYFSLKDGRAIIRAVMFKSYLARLKFRPEDGQKVVLTGAVTLYVAGGTYQITASSMEPDGVGALALAFEQLKRKLAAEGLFDESIKKPLPKCPRRIGVITSPTGAAVRDIISVTGRRFPICDIVLYPSLVQGEGAEAMLIEGIKYFGRGGSDVDVIIIGRGGGSIEDLWAFNSEALAREIRRSQVPVISAVGHETDFTICDFASDKRAPTPSAAAELAVPDTASMLVRFGNLENRMAELTKKRIERYRLGLGSLSGRRVMTDPRFYAEQRRMKLLDLSSSLERNMTRSVADGRKRLAGRADMLNALSPLRVLSKGYTAVFDGDGRSVRSASGVSVGDSVSLTLADGRIDAEVTGITLERTEQNGQTNDV